MESTKGGDWMRTSENKEEFREQYRLLGLRIAYYRKRKGWTQEQLADEVGCSWSFLSQLESNNSDRIHAPSLYMLFKIAQVLDVPASKLFEE
ncbi:helix-turn-helix domain-containing protein [Dysosmobacter sp.]|uniref:helix-turn-helix domain-containing protein n=2 Tax=Dysosmobacter sp. TaxID=2591382 RepID=UPI002D803C06|nr:helix-turn-helix transcriptional regulator [Dysosmobacter sp.]